MQRLFIRMCNLKMHSGRMQGETYFEKSAVSAKNAQIMPQKSGFFCFFCHVVPHLSDPGYSEDVMTVHACWL
jgi:hypothetical protein